MVPETKLFCTESEPFHDAFHIIGAFGVKQDIMVGHLPHAVDGIEVLQHNAFERHIPDTGSLQLRKQRGHLHVHRGAFERRMLQCSYKALILYSRRFQRGGNRCRQLMPGGELIYCIQIHFRNTLRIRRNAVYGA